MKRLSWCLEHNMKFWQNVLIVKQEVCITETGEVVGVFSFSFSFLSKMVNHLTMEQTDQKMSVLSVSKSVNKDISAPSLNMLAMRRKARQRFIQDTRNTTSATNKRFDAIA